MMNVIPKIAKQLTFIETFRGKIGQGMVCSSKMEY
jgi:hypothetical protein